jgi:lipopolysaccharide/colanic/teichoic acid biosynthesis glycosyltransferase
VSGTGFDLDARRPDYALKRPLDLVLAGAGALASSPLWLVLGAAVKLTSPGPVFHRATRVGRDGVPFTLYKFRTMRVNAATTGPAVTAGGDPRITKVGKLLRGTKLDELPQLINVVRGDMSLVGPRPEDARYVAHYSERDRRVLRVRPGITGSASVAYRDEEAVLAAADDLEAAYIGEVMPAKLALEQQYLDTISLRTDVGLLWATLRAIVRR